MSIALTLIARAIQLLTYDPLRVARIMLPAFLGWLAYEAVAQPFLLADAAMQNKTAGQIFIALAVALLTALVLIPWSAVSFHRYVLLNETGTGIFPKWVQGRVLSYFWCGFVIGLIVIFPALILVLILSILINGSVSMVPVVGLVANTMIYWMVLRFGLVLPAVSLDRKMRIGESWTATSQRSDTILLIAFLLALPQAIISLLGLPYSISAAVGALTWVVHIAVLTTLYGHLIEDRPMEVA